MRQVPGHRERKQQAGAERGAVGSGALPPAEPLPPQTLRAPSIGSTSFAGMDFGDTPGFVPPDTHSATGPDHIIETVNTTVTIYNRADGTIASGPPDLNTFCGVASTHSLTDPVVAYDEILQV